LVYFVVIWNIFPRFVLLFREKSGNPALDQPSGHGVPDGEHDAGGGTSGTADNERLVTQRRRRLVLDLGGGQRYDFVTIFGRENVKTWAILTSKYGR
jgi:hypothetical protein